ncbi:MAG TPA: hypothetical protein VJ246_02865 [Patescibacteria group bacterium]|nr:hypothetical protein [Patescibacteria group bacterium]
MLLNALKHWRALSLVGITLVFLWFLSEQFTLVPYEYAQANQTTAEIPQQQTPQEKSDNDEGNVTLSAEVLSSTPTKTVIRASLNTHSVDISNVEWISAISLKKDGKVIRPISSVDEGAGHHRSSTIDFPKTTLPFSVTGTNIGGVSERILEFP